MRFRDAFSHMACWAAQQSGRSYTFVAAVLIVLVWALTGPLFHWSDTWQLIINTGTTVVTFLMVFLIQNSQNRDTEAMQLKLDELIRVNRRARNGLLSLEDLSEDELRQVKVNFRRLAETARDAAAETTSAVSAVEHAERRANALTGRPGRRRRGAVGRGSARPSQE